MPVPIAATMIDALVAPVLIGEDRLHLSGSVGIAIAPDHATAVGDLLKTGRHRHVRGQERARRQRSSTARTST